MAQDRRLKRGLEDVSPLFFSSQEKIQRQKSILPQTKIHVFSKSTSDSSKSKIEPAVYCSAILSHDANSELLSNRFFMNAMAAIYPEVCFVARTEKKWLSPSFGKTIHHMALSPYQIYDILHPEPKIENDFQKLSEHQEDVCFIIEPDLLFKCETNFFQILDYVILYVSGDSSDSIMSAYQSVVTCLQWHPWLQFYLLVGGPMAEKMSEMIYERFAVITSRFHAQDVGFLGWVGNDEIRINHDLLLSVDKGHLVRNTLKTQLLQIFREELLLESAGESKS